LKTRKQIRQRLMSDINVVPYIDVMLVLLVIFMVTAPLVTQGVKITLPQAPSKVIPSEQSEPIIVTVDSQGSLYVDVGENSEAAISEEMLVTRVAAIIKYRPGSQFLLRGDEVVDYGRIVRVMALIQSAGVESVGLITQTPN
jgi:biopolymer transport protein TolR